MTTKETDTEQHIKNVAKRVFFAEGRFDATTQEIADAAGVNRTLLNYYYRSRDLLFNKVLVEARQKIDARFDFLFGSGEPFKQKIEKFLDHFLEESLELPYLETYFVSQINKHISGAEELDFPHTTDLTQLFFKEVEEEVKKGTIREIEPFQFLLNLVSLIAHPIAIQPMLKKVLNLSNEQYTKMMRDRKEIILKMLFI